MESGRNTAVDHARGRKKSRTKPQKAPKKPQRQFIDASSGDSSSEEEPLERADGSWGSGTEDEGVDHARGRKKSRTKPLKAPKKRQKLKHCGAGTLVLGWLWVQHGISKGCHVAIMSIMSPCVKD